MFEEVLFFKLHTTKKLKNKQLIQLILCQLEWGRLAEGKEYKTDSRKRPFNLSCVLDLFSERWQSTLFRKFFFYFIT